MRIDVVWFDPLMVEVFTSCLSMHVEIMALKAIDVKWIDDYDAYVYEVMLWRLCMKSSMLAWCLKCVDDEEYNVNDNVRDKVWSTWLIMLGTIVEWPLPIWPLYECLIIYMLGVPIQCWMCPCLLWWSVGVWSRIPKGFICELLMIWGHCECVVIPWREVHSISMLLLLCHYEDQYAHTHSTCIAMNMMCYGVYWKVNSYMHPYILLCMQSVWLARYEYVLYKGVYVKGFLTYVHTHMNEWIRFMII